MNDVAKYLPFVRSIARRFRGLGLPHEDLVQEGSVGLVKAANAFDPQRGTPFPTFAASWVEGEIRDALARVPPAAEPLQDTPVPATEADPPDVAALLDLLSPVQRQVLTLRYGLADGQPQSYREIADRLSLSVSTAHAHHRAAIDLLKESGRDCPGLPAALAGPA